MGGCVVGNLTSTDIIGQIFGVIAVIFAFLSYQMDTNKKLLTMQTVVAGVFCIHYFLIGAIPAMALNMIAFLRNATYANRDKKIFSFKLLPVVFASLMFVFGIVTWEGLPSLFITVGLIINTLCLALPDPQKIRKSILVSSPLVLIYNLCVLSVGGSINESVTIISSVIGIIRYRKEKTEEC